MLRIYQRVLIMLVSMVVIVGIAGIMKGELAIDILAVLGGTCTIAVALFYSLCFLGACLRPP